MDEFWLEWIILSTSVVLIWLLCFSGIQNIIKSVPEISFWLNIFLLMTIAGKKMVPTSFSYQKIHLWGNQVSIKCRTSPRDLACRFKLVCYSSHTKLPGRWKEVFQVYSKSKYWKRDWITWTWKNYGRKQFAVWH